MESGLVVTTKVGNQKHFQANAAAPIFHELLGIVLKTFGLATPVRAALSGLAEHIRVALIYGSIAKRTDSAFSDVDLLVVSDTLTLEQLFAALAPAERALARKINITLYNSNEFRRRRGNEDSFLSKVLAGEHWVLMGDPGANISTRQPRPNPTTQS